MDVFLQLFAKIFPLYILIGLGFLTGKYLHVKKHDIASILIYIISPIVFFNGVYISKLTLGALSLPLLYFLMSSTICLLFLLISKLLWKDSVTRHIFAFVTGESNTGYFGLPVAVSLFGDQILGAAVLLIVGSSFYESVLGYFVAARGKHSIKESLLKIFKIPPIYALIIGIIFNLLHINLGPSYNEFATHFKGAYSVLGMMLIGLAISEIKDWKFDFKFVSMTFLTKFLVWPLFMGIIIYLDSQLYHIYDQNVHNLMILMSIVPIAANSVIYATLLNAHPEKVSVAVVSSTLFALIYIPLFVSFVVR